MVGVTAAAAEVFQKFDFFCQANFDEGLPEESLEISGPTNCCQLIRLFWLGLPDFHGEDRDSLHHKCSLSECQPWVLRGEFNVPNELFCSISYLLPRLDSGILFFLTASFFLFHQKGNMKGFYRSATSSWFNQVFAADVIKMFNENSFQSIPFCYDQNCNIIMPLLKIEGFLLLVAPSTQSERLVSLATFAFM